MENIYIYKDGTIYNGQIEQQMTVSQMMQNIIKTEVDITIYDISLNNDTQYWIKELDQNEFEDMTEKSQRITQSKTYMYVMSLIGDTYKIDIMNDHKAKIKIFNGFLLLRHCEDIKEFYKGVEKLHANGWTGLTLAACSFKAFRQMKNKYDWSSIMVDQRNDFTPDGTSFDDFIRDSYRGGWCYLNPKFAHKKIGNGVTYDVNSLYPYIMTHYRMPIGHGEYFEGHYTKAMMLSVERGNACLFQKITCDIKLREGYLPVFTNDDYFMFGTRVENTNEWHKVSLTLTFWELWLMWEHYDIWNIEWEGGIFFKNTSGNLFQKFVDRFYGLKKVSKGVERDIYKGFMNYLSGSMAKKNVRQNIALKPQPHIYTSVLNTPSYIHIGAWITSMARCKIIKDAQKNFENFVYSDTDSIHVVGYNNTGIELGEEIGQYKTEHIWQEAYFYGKKTYGLQCKDGLHLTLAGIPKSITEKREQEYNHKVREFFMKATIKKSVQIV